MNEEPNAHDVLCGRGGDVNEHRGNIQMRGMASAVRQEYLASKKSVKSRVVERVVTQIHEKGGRFLKRDPTTDLWCEISNEQARKKVAQALRDSVPDKEVWEEFANQKIHPFETLQEKEAAKLGQEATKEASMLPLSSFVEPSREKVALSPTEVTVNSPDSSEIDLELDAEDEALLLVSMFPEHLEGPKFTEEQELDEMNGMTEEERLSVLSDIFGDSCEITRPKKKVARCATVATMDSLLRDMRSEIDATSIERKGALVEALQKGRLDEFSDSRMELFLVRENMNAKLAANRCISYWDKRRELFGADCFYLPMTVDGALRHDKAALEAGVITLLPKPDTSGRPILYYLPHRHTRKDYDRDSLLRAIWYIFEQAVSEERNGRNGVIMVSNWKPATLWDYDRLLEEGFAEMERLHLPLRFSALHCTGLPPMLISVMRPVVFALLDKDTRARLLPHVERDDALIERLERYGLPKDALPVEMGGDCQPMQ